MRVRLIIPALQLLISFLAPTFLWGSRHVFLSDLFCFLCIGPGLLWAWFGASLDRKAKRQLVYWVGGCTTLLGLTYLHGYFRPALEPLLTQIYFRINPDNDTFNAKREFIFLIRFLAWLAAAGLVSLISFSKTELTRLLKTLTVCLLSASAIMVLAKLSPGFHGFLEKFYNRDSSYDIWKFRSYGPFASPVEGGAVLGLALILTVGSGLLSRGWMLTALLAAGVGLLLTHAMTAVVALCVAGAYAGTQNKQRLNGRRVVLASAVVLLIFVVVLGVLYPGALSQKRVDVFARLAPWLVLVKAIGSRLDLILFGLGLPDYSVDNSYLFVFTRGGLLGVGCLLWLSWRFGVSHWRRLGAELRAALIYLAVVGLMFDVIVYRNIVYLMLAVGIPLLTFRKKDA